jgi:predicted nucleic acid-binding protein
LKTLFDTDVIIWALRGSHKAAAAIDKAPERFISAVTFMELIKGSRDKAEWRRTKGFLHDLGFETLPVSGNVSHRAMIYMEEFALSTGMDLADALIAATASENALRLCSGNAKHYKSIRDIELAVFKPE